MASGWTIGGPSPFLTERARRRAPEILAYAAAPGGAVLVGPDGDIALCSGFALDVDLARVARMAVMLGGGRSVISFASGRGCVHAAPVHDGWMLCVVSLTGVSPVSTIERLRRAAHVLALALVDGMGTGSPGGADGTGAPAEVSASVTKKNRAWSRADHSSSALRIASSFPLACRISEPSGWSRTSSAR